MFRFLKRLFGGGEQRPVAAGPPRYVMPTDGEPRSLGNPESCIAPSPENLRAFDARHLAPFRHAPDRRRSYGLPEINSPDELWRFLGLSGFKELAFLAQPDNIAGGMIAHRDYKRLLHYHIRAIPKKDGGERLIASPRPRLKKVQRRIHREILAKIPLHPAATGFRRGKSIADHAGPHVGHQVVAAWDLRDFFPSISQRRTASFFRWLGYPASVARILSLLTTTCTGTPGVRATRHLPQGAPTSPALANAMAFRLDVRLAGLARRFGATYTRYADDLAFSGDEDFKRGLSRFIPLVEKIVRSEGFRIHPGKRRFMRRGRRQCLTGLNVNERLSVGRTEIDALKAILHNAGKAGSLESQNRDGRADFAAHVRGRIAWVERFHPARGAKLRAAFAALHQHPGPVEPTIPLPQAPPPE
ncbi:MAG: RNA-directed polymerase [Candidatus Sumerlaeota bacterium]|nr:RNA-directed polymerase [Candidatus Sumerlaeota bacterium]